MDAVIDNIDVILRGFGATLLVTLLALVLAVVLGTATACFRVSPLKPLSAVGTAYVGMVRNTPLTVIFFMVVFGTPEVGLNASFTAFAVVALGVYTGPFIGEVLRSGIQGLHTGQGEAARSLGMSFGQSLRYVILPQAARDVVAPLGNVCIATLKNSSVAMAFGVFEATAAGYTLANANATAVIQILAAVAVGYLCLTSLAAVAIETVEHRVRIVR
ncbi:amino acid ABC transporter permease [Ornithinimicrobium cavernae]|uniref:amino acid ABC transporter permease n=1 Tax=Ornithinimicrobium cavernae TaxID=2666047 RepID=UPI000D6915C7|nr:amino acid ABC transporter permease [Ornithinimicrobium cavernae]